MNGNYGTIGALFLGAIATQVAGLILLPLTRGATQLVPTLGVMACFCLFTILIARLMNAGVNLGLMVPLISAAVPLAAIVIGSVLYGEPISLLKGAILLVACLLVAAANMV